MPSNEVESVNYLRSILEGIKTTVPENVLFEVDVQHPSGYFTHTNFLNGFTNLYSNVSNVVVRLSWIDQPNSKRNGQEESLSSILLNAHFDSYLTGPGASDDGVGVAVLLEVARALAHGPALPHPVVLLLNGAEESHQQAAHGFITQHPWARSTRAVINLEATGSGGRELMFQCNSHWAARVYRDSAPHPFASVFAHELFKLVLHRFSATDWATFMTYGPRGIVGIDTAYIENG